MRRMEGARFFPIEPNGGIFTSGVLLAVFVRRFTGALKITKKSQNYDIFVTQLDGMDSVFELLFMKFIKNDGKTHIF